MSSTGQIETLELSLNPLCRETLETIIDDCQSCCRDDLVSLVDELPSAEAIQEMRVRRAALGRYHELLRSMADDRAEIPLDLLDEIAQICGYRIDLIADRLKPLGRMGWDDCQHFDSEQLANDIYSVHELLTKLRRMQFEIERGITGNRAALAGVPA